MNVRNSFSATVLYQIRIYIISNFGIEKQLRNTILKYIVLQDDEKNKKNFFNINLHPRTTMSTTDSDSNKIAKQTKSRNQNKQTMYYQTNFDTQNQMEDHFCMIYVILSLVEAAEKVLH